MPTPRSEMRAAVLDGEVIVPGGLGSDRALDVVGGIGRRWFPRATAWPRPSPAAAGW